MYGSQPPPDHPPGSYHHPPGPPQPEWRPSQPAQNPQSPQSWHLPGHTPPPPPPPPPAPASSYNPNVYGPMPSALPAANTSIHLSPVPGGANTSTWGVRYNQQQHHTPPPLPPRPSSSGNQAQAYILSVGGSSPGPSPPRWNASQTGNQLPPTSITETHQQPWNESPFHEINNQPLPPPPPPPIPPGYQSELQQQAAQTWQPPQHPPYSQHPPTHRYDPPAQPPSAPYGHVYNQSYATANSTTTQSPVSDHQKRTSPLMDRPLPPLPPENAAGSIAGSTSYTAPLTSASTLPVRTTAASAVISSSALGAGNPSDWEHFSAAPGDVDDTEAFQVKNDHTSQPSNTFELPTSPSPSVSTSAPGTQADNYAPATSSPVQDNANGLYMIPRKPSPTTSGKAGVAHGTQTPPPVHPPRVDSLDSTRSGISMNDSPESIDGVIEAWTRPMSSDTQSKRDPSKPAESSRQSSVSTLGQPSPAIRPTVVEQDAAGRSQSTSTVEGQGVGSVPPRTPPKDDVVGPISKPEVASPQQKLPDPYEDLDPWFRSSLSRYVTMLRKEAVAESDEERYKIFTAFAAKETKLREILYNIEPPIREDARGTQPSHGEHTTRSKSADATPQVDPGLIPLESDSDTTRPQVVRFATTVPDNFSEQSGEGAYSPGGRPILSVQTTSEGQVNRQGLHRSASHPARFAQAQDPTSGASVTAAQLDDHLPRSTSVPPTSVSNPWRTQTMTPLISNPPQPIYTPFRYTEGPQRGSDNLIFDGPAYQAYSALRQASAESGRAMSHTPAPTSRARAGTLGSSPAHEHDETFLGLIREKSVTYRGKRRGSTPPTPLLPEAFRQGKTGAVVEELRSLIPHPFPEKTESPWIAATRKDIDKYSDDFRYIQKAVEDWERSAKGRREQLDKERMARQEESEKYVDALFNDKEIGYSDINALEDDFRHTEAKAQLEEERQELEKFITDVFNPLDQRLKDEISKLKAQYKLAVDELDTESSSTKDSMRDKYQFSHTMKLVNDIYQKLEVRYQKRLDIALDRERRRKKAERRPLIFLGDSPALKKLDGDFDSMERRNILEAANERDARANRLMDSFDDAIMRGLGEHQTLLDDISAKVKNLDPNTIDITGPDVETILRSTSAFVKFLEADSEFILRSFGIADSSLNNADYSVSVAEARYSNADADIFRRLDEEKKKEDAKIQHDLDTKLESVRKGPAEITAKIDGLLETMGKEPGPGPGPWGRPKTEDVNANHPTDVLMPGPRPSSAAPPVSRTDGDPEQQERLRKALEDAKRRNAAKQQS